MFLFLEEKELKKQPACERSRAGYFFSLRGLDGYAKPLWLAALRCKGYGVVMAGLRAGHARPLQSGVNELRAKARPTECGKVGCRAACPQAAAEVCGNEKPCGLL